MPYKLKSSARRSRRNKRIGIVVGIALLVVVLVAAFYVFGQPTPVVQYGLLVEVGGSGSTNATGTQIYNAEELVTVEATANPDWVLNDWLLNGTSVGSVNPRVLTMSENFNLTAVFTEVPASDKVLLQTSMGDIVIQLRDDKPNTSGNFKKLVQEGKYDGTIFHRVIDGFIIQGGDPTGTGAGDPSIATIPDEIGSDNLNIEGTIAMANTGQPNSASSQFFINVVDNSGTNRFAGFDQSYTVFGTVIQGMDVAKAISQVPTDENDKPLTDVVLIKAEILP
jgi:peptidylprolyl isomerase